MESIYLWSFSKSGKAGPRLREVACLLATQKTDDEINIIESISTYKKKYIYKLSRFIFIEWMKYEQPECFSFSLHVHGAQHWPGAWWVAMRSQHQANCRFNWNLLSVCLFHLTIVHRISPHTISVGKYTVACDNMCPRAFSLRKVTFLRGRYRRQSCCY